MADLIDDVISDLGTRRPPRQWVSLAPTLQDRSQVKQQRRHELETGAPFPGGGDALPFPATATPEGMEGARKQDRGLPYHLGLRRRDEHAFLPPSQRSSRAARQESIARQLHMKREPIDTSLTWLPPEDEEGHIEYKYKLSHPPPHPIRLQQLITQMSCRLKAGGGQCFYYIGVEDDGYPKGLGPAELDASMATLYNMVQILNEQTEKEGKTLNVQATVVRIFPGAHGRRCALVRVQQGILQEVAYVDLRVAVAGCVDAGKSTLVAVLTHGTGGTPMLDTGRGSARVAVLRHKHEIESGRTSSLSHQFLGYDREGRVLNYRGCSPAATLTDVCTAASKLLTFIDMGGHERCLKTALYGMTALLPDYALLCCCAVRGLGHMSREHLAVAVALQIPVAVCITKVDLVDDEGLAAVVDEIRSLVSLAWRQHRSGHSPKGQRPAPPIQLGLPPHSTSQPSPAASVAAADMQQQPAVATAAEAPAADQGAGVAPCPEMAPVIDSEPAAEQAARALGQMHVHQQQCDSTLLTSNGQGGHVQPAGTLPSPPVLVPILPVSAVTGQGLEVLHAFLRALTPRHSASHAQLQQPAAPPVTGMASAPDLTVLSSSKCHDSLSPTATAAPPVQPHGATRVGGLADTPETAMQHGASRDDVAAASPASAPTSAPAAAAGAHMGLHDMLQGSKNHTGVHFQVDQNFEVSGVGSVVSGVVLQGVICLDQHLLLGPTPNGQFTPVKITGIQRAHIPVQLVRAGQAATLAFKAVGNTAGLLSPAAAAAAAPGQVDSGRQQQQEQQQQQQQQQSEGNTATATATVSAAVQESVQAPAADALPSRAPASGGAVDAAHDLLDLFDLNPDDALSHTTGQEDDLAGLFSEDSPGRARSPAAPPRMPPGTAASAPISVTVRGRTQRTPPPDEHGDRPRITHEALLAGELHPHMPASPSLPSFLLSEPEPASAPRHSGAVLLGAALSPRAVWAFEAVLVLLGGHWPPRGLLSGCWPPVEEDGASSPTPTPGDVAAAVDTGGDTSAGGQRTLGRLPGDGVGGHVQAAAGRGPAGDSGVLGDIGGEASSSVAASCRGSSMMLHGGSVCTTTTPERSSSSCSETDAAGYAAARRLGLLELPGAQHTVSCSAPSSLHCGRRRGHASHGSGNDNSGGKGIGHVPSYSVAVQHPQSVACSPSERHAADPGCVASQRGAGRAVGAATPAPQGSTADAGHDSIGHGVGGLAGVAGDGDEDQRLSGRRSHRRRGKDVKAAQFTCVIHCASVRQQARLVSMQELGDPNSPRPPSALLPPQQPPAGAAAASSTSAAPMLHITPSMQAAAALLHADWQPRPCLLAGTPAPEEGRASPAVQEQALPAPSPDLGCIVRATFRFEHRPEWLCEGARLVVRDRTTGHVSGAGYVRAVTS